MIGKVQMFKQGEAACCTSPNRATTTVMRDRHHYTTMLHNEASTSLQGETITSYTDMQLPHLRRRYDCVDKAIGQRLWRRLHTLRETRSRRTAEAQHGTNTLNHKRTPIVN